jgi:hypothetical protein
MNKFMANNDPKNIIIFYFQINVPLIKLCNNNQFSHLFEILLSLHPPKPLTPPFILFPPYIPI